MLLGIGVRMVNMSKFNSLGFLLVSAFIFLLPAVAKAQGFPWGDFTSRTLNDIRALEKDVEENKEKPGEPHAVMHVDKLLSRVRVTYTGESRPVSDLKKALIKKMGAGV
jgi:hypothetical protein